MNRISLKIAGAQGQGINSVGEMCAKGLKRAGYCVFGYKEYMSLIKGGHSTYQLDISTHRIGSSETLVDILICFNHHGLEINWNELKDGGVIVHQSGDWTWSKEQEAELKKRNVTVLYLPTEDILSKIKAKPILSNVVITAVVWALLGKDKNELKELVTEQFGHKKDLLELNFLCIEAGFTFKEESAKDLHIEIPELDTVWSDSLLVTGSQAMGMGIVHAGCRVYVGYPMTPSSQLLDYISSIQDETGMVIKQAEDEITAAQMMSGAMLMGTRAMTGTSGGGFDLMTETVSLNGIIENPSVFLIAQRPGPATGLPTWTAQGDLLLAVGSAHGEFAKLIVSVSDSQDSFDLMPEVFNLAEEFQIPVMVLTDKHIAEALWTQKPYDQKKAEIRRGELVTDAKKLAKLKATDRYATLTKSGVTPRWLPGTKADTFVSQGDEHNEDGSVDESKENAKAQMEKRMRKMQSLKEILSEPEFFVAEKGKVGVSKDADCDLLLVSWGSNKGVIFDALLSQELEGKKIGYLHYSYLWPLKTERFEALHSRAKKSALIECNFQGQLGKLLKMECGVDIENKILKYDGRPYFVDELTNILAAL